MKRRTFDSLASFGGVVLTIVLLVAGGLLMWGAGFANSNVHDQLGQQQITFPAAGSAARTPASPSRRGPRRRPMPTTSSPCT
jgi:hypothetical protein